MRNICSIRFTSEGSSISVRGLWCTQGVWWSGVGRLATRKSMWAIDWAGILLSGTLTVNWAFGVRLASAVEETFVWLTGLLVKRRQGPVLHRRLLWKISSSSLFVNSSAILLTAKSQEQEGSSTNLYRSGHLMSEVVPLKIASPSTYHNYSGTNCNASNGTTTEPVRASIASCSRVRTRCSRISGISQRLVARGTELCNPFPVDSI